MSSSSINTALPVPSETVSMEMDTVGILEMILNNLAGRVYDPSIPPNGGYRQIGKKMVNELGEKALATVLAAYISRDKILSILDIKEIRKITHEATDSVAGLLVQRYDEFGIEKSDLAIVMSIIEHSIYANLKRAIDGRTLDHLANIVRINEKGAEKRAFLGGFPALFGGKKEPEQEIPQYEQQ